MESRNQPMAEYIDARFTRVEKALETLIKSITGYNPSPAIANDLVAADTELNQGLEHLHTHQTNHTRLEAKRNETASLDNKIKETLLLLSSTRAELLATPGTKFSDTTPQYPVSYSELLSYARRISKTTLPRTYREPDTTAVATPKEKDVELNGVATVTVTTPSASAINGGQVDVVSATTPAGEKSTTTTTNPTENPPPNTQHTTALPQDFTSATSLPPSVFVPWPNENLLRRGALATIQQLLEKGEEIEGYDAEKGAKELEAKRRAEAEEEEERERARAMRNAAAAATGGAAGGRVQEPKKKFVVDEFDSDDDED